MPRRPCSDGCSPHQPSMSLSNDLLARCYNMIVDVGGFSIYCIRYSMCFSGIMDSRWRTLVPAGAMVSRSSRWCIPSGQTWWTWRWCGGGATRKIWRKPLHLQKMSWVFPACWIQKVPMTFPAACIKDYSVADYSDKLALNMNVT